MARVVTAGFVCLCFIDVLDGRNRAQIVAERSVAAGRRSSATLIYGTDPAPRWARSVTAP